MTKHMPLTAVAVGATVSVIEILGGQAVHDRLRALGIRPGVKVKKVSGTPGYGPTVLQVGGSQTALGQGVSAKIMVEAEE